MKISRIARTAAIGVVASLVLVGCAANEPTPTDTAGPTLSGKLVGIGASAQSVAIDAWKSIFQNDHSAADVEYDPQGSGTGRESFQNGASDFAGTDRGFKVSEIEAGPFQSCVEGSGIIQIPTYVSPIAVVFSLEGIDQINLDPATLASIFAGNITSWNDPAIVATNPGVALPATAITPVHRSDKSGTTGNFTDYLAAVAGDIWTWGSVEEWPSEIQGGEAADKTSGVANAMRAGNGLIGYLDASQATGFSPVAVKVGNDFVVYSAAGAAATLDDSEFETGRANGDLVFKINRTTAAAGAYPLLLVSYLVACEQYKDTAKADLARAFLTVAVSAAGQQEAAKHAGSAPISEKLRTAAQAAIALIK